MTRQLLALLMIGWAATGAPLQHAPTTAQGAPYYAGWAVSAYPEMSQDALDAAVARQKAAGANLVWIGHNNPGEVGARKREPAPSYAVYAAYRDPRDPLHADAVAITRAQFRMLAACRKAGMAAIFPIGYQIQMGKAWNAAHPGDVRRDAAGKPLSLFGGGVSASFYAPAYRRDITAYYRWVQTAFVQPYSDTITMLNLADEPSGGDYSAWADADFRAVRGYGLREAGADPRRQNEVGAYQSAYIARYASWSAARWLAINPAISTTMSFDGGQSRYAYQEPLVESLFRDPPPNFAVTFDAYPRDGLFGTPLREGDLIALGVFVRALGAYSARYHRPLYLWSAANSWGLNGASPDPGNVADAVTNGLALAAWTASTGGDLRGIAAWSYNVKGQGLYNDSHHTVYTPDAMFKAVSASFATLRAVMARPRPRGHADTAILAPDGPSFTLLGSHLAARGIDPYGWTDLAALTRNDAATAVLSAVAPTDLDGIGRVIVLPTTPDDLTMRDLTTLRAYLRGGGAVVATPAVGAALLSSTASGGSGPGRARIGPAGPSARRSSSAGATLPASLRAVGAGVLVTALCGGRLEPCFSDAASGRWATLLGRPVSHAGYVISGGGVALLYTIAPAGSAMGLRPQAGALWTAGQIFGTNGLPRATLPDAATPLTVTLGHREYALYTIKG